MAPFIHQSVKEPPRNKFITLRKDKIKKILGITIQSNY